jgi:hypothetical protein
MDKSMLPFQRACGACFRDFCVTILVKGLDMRLTNIDVNEHLLFVHLQMKFGKINHINVLLSNNYKVRNACWEVKEFIIYSRNNILYVFR